MWNVNHVNKAKELLKSSIRTKQRLEQLRTSLVQTQLLPELYLPDELDAIVERFHRDGAGSLLIVAFLSGENLNSPSASQMRKELLTDYSYALAHLAPVLSDERLDHDLVLRRQRAVVGRLQLQNLTEGNPPWGGSWSKLHLAWDLAEFQRLSNGTVPLAEFAAELLAATQDTVIHGPLQAAIAAANHLLGGALPALGGPADRDRPRVQLYFQLAKGEDASRLTSETRLLAWSWVRWGTGPAQPLFADEFKAKELKWGYPTEFLERVQDRLTRTLGTEEGVPLELFLPLELLGQAVDQWEIDVGSFQPDYVTIGKRHAVVVRVAIPHDPKRPDRADVIRSRFKPRWDAIRGKPLTPADQLADGVLACCWPEEPAPAALGLPALDKHLGLGCIVSRQTCRAGEPLPLVSHALTRGVPILAWARSDEAAAEMLAAKDKLFCWKPEELPHKIWELRKAGGTDRHLPQHLTLFVEDADHQISNPREFT